MSQYDQNGYIVLVADGEQSGSDSRESSYEVRRLTICVVSAYSCVLYTA